MEYSVRKSCEHLNQNIVLFTVFIFWIDPPPPKKVVSTLKQRFSLKK